MAKNDKPASNKPSKMTVMLFQLEGSDETLQEGFRTINNAIDKLANPVVRVIGGPSPVRSLPASTNGADGDAPAFDAEIVDESVGTENTPTERPKMTKAFASAPTGADARAGIRAVRDTRGLGLMVLTLVMSVPLSRHTRAHSDHGVFLDAAHFVEWIVTAIGDLLALPMQPKGDTVQADLAAVALEFRNRKPGLIRVIEDALKNRSGFIEFAVGHDRDELRRLRGPILTPPRHDGAVH